MSENTLLTILHISDFHYKKTRHREQKIVVDALINDLKTLCIGHRKPDFVIFTGDLVHAAGLDTHDEAYDFLIDPVSKATGCSDERIFIAAGNHDVSRIGVEKHHEENQKWREVAGSEKEVDTINSIYERGEFEASVNGKYSNYLDLENYISNGYRGGARKNKNTFFTVDHVSALNTDIVIFNTSAFSMGGHKDFGSDERKLMVPEYAIREALTYLSPNSFRIFVTHHPLSWLTEQSSKLLENEITKNAHMHLFGHMHDPKPRRIVGLTGDVVSNQAGGLFTARKDYYNGYSLITVDKSNFAFETLIRSYYKERDEFDAGVDYLHDGRWWSSQEAKQHFRKIATPVDESEFRNHLAGEALQLLKARESLAGGDAETHNRFVAPPLIRTFIREAKEEAGKIDNEETIKFSDIVEGDANLILYARPEYGRTTLLNEIKFQSLERAHDVRIPRIPMMLNFEDVSANVDNMLRKVRGASEACPDQNDPESLLTLGYATVLIDDVVFWDKARTRILRAFVQRFPKARYILSSPQSSATQHGACINPEMPVRFEFVEIRELRRRDMRQLLAKDERCTDVEAWLDRLQNEFREINLPFTAANGSILIDILSEKYNFNPINHAVLMEQFVDSTLRKAAIEQSRRETFDYTNKTDLLSCLAAWMAEREDYVPKREDVRSEMKSYVDTRGLNANLDGLLSEFLNSRIFVSRSDGKISFRYRGVLEYFIALRMISDPTFKDWIMADERYLRYTNEINYFAGKFRNDAKLVDLVAERHQSIMDEALIDLGEIDLNQLDSVQLPTDKADEDVADIASTIAAPPLTKEEKDEELDLEFPVDAEDRQEVYRPKVERIGEKVLLSLILYSGLVKNMEFIEDGDKRRHLQKLWHSWSIMLVSALRFAPRLAAERKIRINGALYEVQAPQGMSDSKLLRQMMLSLPHVHIRMIFNALGTEKLERPLTELAQVKGSEKVLDSSIEPQPKIYEFLRTGLISELRLQATPDAIRTLADKLRGNRYLLWSLIVHVGHLRRLDRLKDEHFLLLDEPLAGAIANLKGGSHSSRMEEKQRQLRSLERDRLFLKMTRDKD